MLNSKTREASLRPGSISPIQPGLQWVTIKLLVRTVWFRFRRPNYLCSFYTHKFCGLQQGQSWLEKNWARKELSQNHTEMLEISCTELMKQHYINANKALKLFSSQYLCWCLEYQWTLVWFGNLDTSAQRQHTGRQETAAHAPPHQTKFGGDKAYEAHHLLDSSEWARNAGSLQ